MPTRPGRCECPGVSPTGSRPTTPASSAGPRPRQCLTLVGPGRPPWLNGGTPRRLVAGERLNGSDGRIAFGWWEEVAATDTPQLPTQGPDSPCPLGTDQWRRSYRLLVQRLVLKRARRPHRLGELPLLPLRRGPRQPHPGGAVGLTHPARATHSSCSRVRASAGSATSPSASCATPSRRNWRHTDARGVEGSRGSRYVKNTHSPVIASMQPRLLRGQPDVLIDWIDSALLIDLCHDLRIPQVIRQTWDPVVAVAGDGPVERP